MKKKKLIILLSLAMPLTVNALKLQGTQTFIDEINIPITHDFEYSGTEILAGISITPGSNTIFKKNVTINMSRDDIHNIESGVTIHGIRSLNDIGPQSSTVFRW